jgi:hypothetical protein
MKTDKKRKTGSTTSLYKSKNISATIGVAIVAIVAIGVVGVAIDIVAAVTAITACDGGELCGDRQGLSLG